ncbi:MAG: serine/threonine protein kinase [Deltaproteobacteria bacterium]|nr:serine/threonine protein kinase [Deltaproteobacteria bacterium]
MGRASDDDRPTVDLGPRTNDPESHTHVEPASPFDDDPDDLDGAPSEDTPPPTVMSAPPPPQVAEGVHHLPTQQLVRGGKRSASTSLSRLSGTTATSPVEAMRADEVARTRVFLKVVLGICFGGIIVALTADGDPVARSVVLVGTAGSLLGTVWILSRLRDAATWDGRKIVVPGLLIIVGSMSGVYYWGVASPVAAMLVYGIYFFSLGSNARVTLSMYVMVAAAHLLMGGAMIAGVIEDRGVVGIGHLRTLDRISLLCIVECLYLVAFITARVSQRVTLEAMTQLEGAVRGMAQRDALLAEARAELDRALVVGGPGRYTEQVIGKFKLGILIGRGGMGEVYEARAVDGGREAAVKLLHPGTLADPTHVQRFLREADTAARLNCAHVVGVLEVGTTEGGVPFLAMERLRGHDLAHQLRRHKKLSLPQARLFAEQVAVGLDAARAAGIVHRDLKPHNVFFAEVAGVRTWKILDFGVSKAGGTGTLTKGHVIGTPAYMAPEQARGEDVDHRADVYSLGAILYRSVTGHPAFTGKDVPSTLYDVVYRVPSQPTMLANLPADIDRVLAIGLAKDPRDRFATAVELAAWFAAAAADGLTLEQRRRGDDVIARYPWGTRPG